MKKLILLAALLSSALFAKVNAVASIVPEATFVKAIGGDLVDVTAMVLPGNSPHSYEPKPSQMKDVSKADLYFPMDVEFEKAWLPKFKAQNSKMEIVDTLKGIKKIAMAAHHHHDEHAEHEEHKEGADHDEHEHEGHHHDGGLDPHVWVSPVNVKVIAKNIYEALVKVDPKNEATYKKNYENFLKKIDETDAKIKETLSGLKQGTAFIIFHPAFGYFAKEYNLKQVPIEVEGKEPKPKELAYLMDKAKEEGARAIFAEPEFSDKSAQLIAKELNIPVIKISPMAENWSENLINFAKAIAHK
ncbi:MAG TPA: zinc ABC transporter substrate-binding protein [Nitratifractor sp.]|nr:zinc ABC transporter substrate-binding protein [Nitratifractor sp.]HHD74559.1 zinc ABC transporter substrate-binding protein [Nitratifractor sp.]